ncbi:MAG: YraN family protein [Ruminiclostridium sp.]|nr:YraN family protein [Ruminiclostridium sp.]
MSVKQTRGKFGEDYTADYLINKGMKILARNFRRKGGELDIIAMDKGELVIVEVKTRKFGSLTDGSDAVTRNKIKNIIVTTSKFVGENDIEFSGIRFDVAEIVITTEAVPSVLEFNYYEDAFTADGFDEITAWL